MLARTSLPRALALARGLLARRRTRSSPPRPSHERIALLQLAGVVFAALVGVAIAVALRLEHLGHGTDRIEPEPYARALTVHGVILLHLVLVPAIAGTVGSVVLPPRVGADRLAFPHLNRGALLLWGLGALSLGICSYRGGPTLGLSLLPSPAAAASPSLVWLAAALIALSASAGLRAVVLLATLRRGARNERPLTGVDPFTASLAAHATVTLVTSPFLLLAALSWLVQPQLGGVDPELARHGYWLGTHGAFFAAALPAIGVVTETVIEFAADPLVSRRSVAFGLLGMALVGVMGWGIHLSPHGQSVTTSLFFALVMLLGAIPAAHLVTSWLLALRRGGAPTAPLWFSLGAILCFSLGVLSGLFLATPSLGPHLRGTAFVVGHAHLVMGSVGLAFCAALQYWWPRLTGRVTSDPWGRVAALLTTVGLLGAHLPSLGIGATGLPRRVATFPSPLQTLQSVGTVGAGVLTLGLGLLAIQLAAARRRPSSVTENPWNVSSAEWTTPPASLAPEPATASPTE